MNVKANLHVTAILATSILLCGACERNPSEPSVAASSEPEAKMESLAAPPQPTLRAKPGRRTNAGDSSVIGLGALQMFKGGSADSADEIATEEAGEAPGSEEKKASPTPTRAWFPETFLFEPRVVTDA